MKIIDKTPFQNQKGEFGLVQRLQGIWEYGGTWHAELDAQKAVIAQLDRVLEKGFTLIRNIRLENSKIVEPLILVGPPGVFIMYVTPVSGFFEAKGDEWNVINNDRRQPAPVNLMKRVARLARALQVYLNRQGMYLPGMFEPVLIASNPAVHIEVLRPIVRVVMSDAVKQFAVSLLQSRPVLQTTDISDLIDHVLRPRRKGAEAEAQAEPTTPTAAAKAAAAGTAAVAEAGATQEAVVDADQAPARARAIFHAAEDLKPFDPADLNFAFDESADAELAAGQGAAGARGGRRWAGITVGQWIVLAVLLLVEFGLLAAFGFLIYVNGF
jgi:hypothetical protein